MKLTRINIAALVVVLMLSGAGCEEVLEICAPCGSIVDGNLPVFGDPRIDDTFKALDAVNRRISRMATLHTKGLEELAAAFDVDSIAVEDIKDAIQTQLFEEPSLSLVTGWEPARCFADSKLATEASYNCEKRVCNALSDPGTFYCAGLFWGHCGDVCDGSCFADAQVQSDGQCIGTCFGAEAMSCPGICAGLCEGDCTARDAIHDCYGYCSGVCSGICEAQVPYLCNGQSQGTCEVSGEENGLCGDSQSCLGSCPAEIDLGQGSCRGHVIPLGSDQQCSDCQAGAKNLAWSGLNCDSGMFHIGMTRVDDSTELPDLIDKIRVLERVVSDMANDHAWLALLVDGKDDTGMMTRGQLFPSPEDAARLGDSYLEDEEELGKLALLGVDATRKYLPLENLRARVAWLSGSATKAESNYTITAGAYACLDPAFKEALSMLDTMLPYTVSETQETATADRNCSNSAADEAVPCIYRLLSEQESILATIVLQD